MSISNDPAPAVLHTVRRALGHQRDLGELNRQHRFDDLRFDSLDRITVAAAIEQSTQLRIPDLVLTMAQTLGDLIDFVAGVDKRTAS